MNLENFVMPKGQTPQRTGPVELTTEQLAMVAGGTSAGSEPPPTVDVIVTGEWD